MQKWQKGTNSRVQSTSLSHLRSWYCRAYANIPEDSPKRVKSHKMQPRAFAGHLVGYQGENGHLFRVYNPPRHRIPILPPSNYI